MSHGNIWVNQWVKMRGRYSPIRAKAHKLWPADEKEMWII